MLPYSSYWQFGEAPNDGLLDKTKNASEDYPTFATKILFLF